ncbi:MAG: SpoIIE family protein phosphatase [Bacteroidales bacterium]|nr:SpoIIE family protein phosphatase [Bacteroidales bacterium]
MTQIKKILKKYSYIVVLLILSANNLYSQNSTVVDSLEKIIKKNVFDSTRTIAYLQLFELYFQTDTSKAYLCLSQLSDEIDKEKYEISSQWIFQLGNLYYQYKNDFKNAIKYLNLAYEKAKDENRDIQIYYECWLGYIYSSMGEHEKARKHLLNSIETAENKEIIKYLPFAYLVYAFELRNADELDKAITYFTKSYEKSSEINDSTYIHVALHEIGNIYTMTGQYDLAIDYHKKALLIREKMNAPAYLMYSYNDIANDYFYMDSINTAIEYYQKAEYIAKNTNDKYVLFAILAGLANCHSYINDYDKEAYYLSEMLIIADELKIKSLYKDLYQQLYLHNKVLKQYPEALQFLELAVLYKDSVSSEEIQKNLNDLDKKYESVKKDKELIENQSYMQKQRMIIVFTIIGLFIFAVFIIIVLRQYRQKKEAFDKLETQNQEILQQNEEIQSQAEHLEQANIEITNQKNIIEKSHHQITASINYAKRIQEAILPKNDLIKMLIPEHFILYLPRDIVSGDFYFIKLYKNKLFITAADCTGHGVPGAFMSMLGFALINELIRKPEIQNPAQLLDELRNQIKTSLQQTGKFDEANDGLDIALLSIDIETNVLNFAGANNPLFLFRNNELVVYKADRMPIGIYIKEKPFTNQIVELKKDDILYVFSDGFVSQFDDKKNETFKIKRFKELLTKIHQKSLSEQKEILEEELSNWKGSNLQTDDILVIGIKIC